MGRAVKSLGVELRIFEVTSASPEMGVYKRGKIGGNRILPVALTVGLVHT